MEFVQEDINVSMRCILVDWLIEVVQVRRGPRAWYQGLAFGEFRAQVRCRPAAAQPSSLLHVPDWMEREATPRAS